jgi:hypothetical protein
MVLGMHPKPADRIPRSERVPWINLEIKIAYDHALKGYSGIVVDVLYNQSTPSGLRVVIQITALVSNAPFRRITVDYDHVVEAR